MLQAMKIPDATAAVEKEWEKPEKLLACQMTKVKSEKEVILEAQKEKESPLCCVDGHLSPLECRIRTEAPKIQRTSRAPRRHSKR